MKKVSSNPVAALREELAALEVQILDAQESGASAGWLKARHRGLLATLHEVRRAEDRRVRALVTRLIARGSNPARAGVRRLEFRVR